jgi:hypothetical protein
MVRAFGAEAGAFGIGVLAATDFGALDRAGLIEVLGLLEMQTGWLAAVNARALVALRDSAGQDDGEWEHEHLRLAQHVSGREAARRMQTACALADRLPATREALEAGAVSWAHAVAIATETGDLDETRSALAEQHVLSDTRAVSAPQFRLAARRQAVALMPVQAELHAADAYASRRLVAWRSGDTPGLGGLNATLTTEDLQTVTAALDTLSARTGPEDERKIEQRRADALVDLCASQLAGMSAATSDPSTHLIVHVPVGLASSGESADHRVPATLADGQPLATSTLRRLACYASVERVVTDPCTGTVLDLGRRCRLPDSRLRRAIGIRDREQCTFPGCTRRRNLHAHHITHWFDGGRTDAANLALVCARHHHAIHTAGWQVQRAADGALTWSHPTGGRHTAVAANAGWSPPPDPPWPEPAPSHCRAWADSDPPF